MDMEAMLDRTLGHGERMRLSGLLRWMSFLEEWLTCCELLEGTLMSEILTASRMIAVMTMNVGYFLSVLGGIFLGSLIFGRFMAHSAGH